MSFASYIGSEDADTYFLEMYGALPTEWAAATTDQKIVALRRATRWMDQTYGHRWLGYRTEAARSLDVDWPRSGVVDPDGYSVDQSTTPADVRRACAEAGLLLLQGKLDSIPTEVASAAVIREKSIGAGSVRKTVVYGGGGISESSASNKRYPLIDKMLARLTRSTSDTVEVRLHL